MSLIQTVRHRDIAAEAIPNGIEPKIQPERCPRFVLSAVREAVLGHEMIKEANQSTQQSSFSFTISARYGASYTNHTQRRTLKRFREAFLSRGKTRRANR